MLPDDASARPTRAPARLCRRSPRLTQATTHQELLERHGMARPVLDHLQKSLSEFEQASREVVAGRLAHVSARLELEQIAKDVLLIMKSMNGHNQLRFRLQPEELAA